MTATRTARWTLRDGRELECRVSVERKVIRKDRVNSDGYIMDVDTYRLSESQEIVAYVADKEVDRAYLGHIHHIKAQDGIVAIIGRVVGLSQERVDLIEAARAEANAEVETDPEIVAYRKAEAKAAEIRAEHDEHAAAVERMMTLGGQTY